VQAVDRRYSQNRFYDGTRATARNEQRGDALVRRYLGRARQENRFAQDFGGSTGGQSSMDYRSGGGKVSSLRRQERESGNAVFESEGSGQLGAAAELKAARPKSYYALKPGDGFSPSQEELDQQNLMP
jgi:hypothetical protein